MLYGETVGILFDKFYTDRLWKKGDGVTDHLLSMVDRTISQVVHRETVRGGVFDWKEKGLKKDTRSVEAVAETVRETIPRGVASIRKYRLLGVSAQAEVKLDSDIGGHRIGGRADFLIKRVSPDNDLVLIDGKGSRWRDKYIDTRQVKWYSMLHKKQFGFMPDALGFLYWRSEPEESLDWVECSESDVETLQATVLADVERIEDGKRRLLKAPGEATLREVFPVRPTVECKLCSYLKVCPEGTTFSEKKVPLPEGIGVEDIGLG